jgi:hypothetical protein
VSVDAGSVNSSIRIKLDQLNADIIAVKSAFDNLGTELKNNAANYSNIAGKQYQAALKKIADETKNVSAAAKAGALSEKDAVSRLLQLRQQELAILQKRAIAEQGTNKATIAAIKESEKAVQSLTEKQKLLNTGSQKSSESFQSLGIAAAAAGGILLATIKGIEKCVDEFAKAEVSAQRLDKALELNGMTKSKKPLTDLAERMQDLTGVDGDYVIQLEAELVAQGRSEKQINDLITAAAGLSEITGDDLSSSLEQLNKMYEGVAPRSSALKTVTEGLTEAQLRNGEGIKLVREKYEQYIGTTGTTITANNRLKESFTDYTGATGRGFASATNGLKNAATGVLTEAAKIQNKVLDAQEAINARKAGTATVDQQILAVETLMFNNTNKNSQLGGSMVAIYNAMRVEVDKRKQAVDELNKTTSKGYKEETELQQKKQTALAKLKEAEDALAKVNNDAAKNKANEQLKIELANWKAEKEEIEKAAKAVGDVNTENDKKADDTKTLTTLQKDYNAAILLSLENQRDMGDVDAGLAERINLTKEYIKSLNAQGASTADAKKALAGYEYQLATLQNVKKLSDIKDAIANIGLSTDDLKKKQREQAIADIENGKGSQESKDALIAKLKEQYELEDKYANKPGSKNKISELDEQIAKLKDLKDKSAEYLESEKERLLSMADASGVTGPALESLKDSIKSTFKALGDSKSAEDFRKTMQTVTDVTKTTSNYLKDFLGAINDAVQASYDKQIEAAQDAADKQQEIMDAQHDAETQALEDEAALKIELIENDGMTREAYLKKQVDDAIAAGDAEAQADSEKQLLLYQTEQEYSDKKKQLADQEAAETTAREKKAAKEKADLEYQAAMVSWNIKMATTIANAATLALQGFMTLPFVPAGLIAGGVATAVGVAQTIAVANARPTPPALATGGIILPSSGGTTATMAENGYGELALNAGPSGDALLETFANKIANAIGKNNSSQPTLYVQNLFGDDASYRELIRKMESLKGVETARRG